MTTHHYTLDTGEKITCISPVKNRDELKQQLMETKRWVIVD